jgi:enterobactin synthetase component D
VGFDDFQIVDITASTLALRFAEQRYRLHWIASEEQVITLCALQQ